MYIEKKSSNTFIHLFNKCVLSIYHVPDNFLGTRDTAMNKMNKILFHGDFDHSYRYCYDLALTKTRDF